MLEAAEYLYAEGEAAVAAYREEEKREKFRRKDRLKGEGQETTVRIGARAVRVFMKCKTGALVESWNVEKLIR